MDFNNKKSFEELLREKVEHHEFPFEANSWSAMQSKLQAHQAQAAATQTTLYKSILLKTGKILVGVISGSAIVYSTLSLSGVLDKKETASRQDKPQQEIAMQHELEQPTNNDATAGNNAMLNITDDNAVVDNAATAQNASSKDVAMQHAASQNNTVAATSKHFSDKGNMQKGDKTTDELLAAQNQVKANEAEQVADKNSAKESLVAASNNNNTKSDLQNQTDVNAAKAETENTYIAAEKNTSAKQDVIATKENLVKESATQGHAKNTPATEENKEELAAQAEADSMLALNNANGGKYPEKPSVVKPSSKIGLIISGGLNNTWLSSREGNSTTLDIIGRPMFGVHAAIPVGEKFAVQAGAQYTTYDIKGVNHESAIVEYAILPSTTVTKTTITESRHIEIPVIVKYAFFPRVNAFAGLRTGILVGAKSIQEQFVNGNSTGAAVTSREEFARYNGLRSVDFGMPLGFEFAISKKISASATYNLGLTDFTYDNVFGNTQKDRHSSLQVQVNFRLF